MPPAVIKRNQSSKIDLLSSGSALCARTHSLRPGGQPARRHAAATLHRAAAPLDAPANAPLPAVQPSSLSSHFSLLPSPFPPAASMACAIRRPRPRGTSCRLSGHRSVYARPTSLAPFTLLSSPFSLLFGPLPWPHSRCHPWHPAASWRRRPCRRRVFCCRCQIDPHPNGRSVSNHVPPLDTANTLPPRPPSGVGAPHDSSRRAATLRARGRTSSRHSLTTNIGSR